MIGRKKFIDKEAIKALCEKGMSDDDIAKTFGCSSLTIQNYRCKLGIKKRFPRKNVSLDFLSLLQKAPVRSDEFKTAKECYRILRQRGIAVQKLELNRYLSYPKKGSTVYYLPGQEKAVFDMIKDSVKTSRTGGIMRRLNMPTQIELHRYRELTGSYKGLGRIEMGRGELRKRVIEIRIKKRIDRIAKEVEALKKQFEKLKMI
jgi:hypothetical protein